jgi:hypothetical protein
MLLIVTHRVAISNHRLLDMDGGQVRFTYTDYLGWTESRPWCAPVPNTSPVSSPTLLTTSWVSVSCRDYPSRNRRICGGSAGVTTLSLRSHVMQSP